MKRRLTTAVHESCEASRDSVAHFIRLYVSRFELRLQFSTVFIGFLRARLALSLHLLYREHIFLFAQSKFANLLGEQKTLTFNLTTRIKKKRILELL